MANTLQGYQHGVRGVRADTIGRTTTTGGSGPVYVGTAPANFATAPAPTNQPVKLRNMSDAEALVGYSKNWSDYTLCEAIKAHFDNAVQPVGPIVVINVLDPAVHKKAQPVTQQLTLVGGVASWADEAAILSTVTVTDEGGNQDFRVVHDAERGVNVFRDLSGAMANPVNISYSQIDPSLIDDEDIIGESDAYGARTGIQAVELVYQQTGIVPATLAAPGWSHHTAVHAALIGMAEIIDNHWFAGVMTDLLVDSTVATREQAITWKRQNGYSSELEVPHWPKGYKGEYVYHLSTIACVAQQQTDIRNSDVPYETPSNKPVDLDGYYVDGTIKLGYTQTDANLLNENGIRTIAYWNGWVLWGSHTGAYEYEQLATMDPRAVFDSNLRMQNYVLNQFQLMFGDRIDKPMTLADAQGIEAEANAWLEQLKANGALLTGDVHYVPERMGDTEMVTYGTWQFSVLVSAPEPSQALVFWVSYDAEGAALARQEQGGE